VNSPIFVNGGCATRRVTARNARVRARDGEHQLVIVTAGEGGTHRIGPARRPPVAGAWRDRQQRRVDHHPNAARRCDLFQRIGEAITQIHGRRRRTRPADCDAQTHSRFRSDLPPDTIRRSSRRERWWTTAQHLQPRGSPADAAAHPNLVSRVRATPRQPFARRDLSARRHIHNQRAIGPRDVAANHRHAVPAGQRRQSVNDLFDLAFLHRRRQHQREQRPTRRRGHGGEITEING
jgi:hypothetical protein